MYTLKARRGDTIIEVIIAITVFCLVAIISINLMSSGINSAEGSLELIMARNEIDAQAEALRFIQNSFLAERELTTSQQQYTQLWRRISGSELDCDPSLGPCGLAVDTLNDAPTTCAEEGYDSAITNNAFVINTRLIEPSNVLTSNINDYYDGRGDITYNRLLGDIIVTARDHPNTFIAPPLYPRIVFSYDGYNSGQDSNDINEDPDGGIGLTSRLYRTVARAEGIWIIAVRGMPDDARGGKPEFFDFYIRTCWYAPGRDYPSTIGTIVRLYNPEIVE